MTTQVDLLCDDDGTERPVAITYAGTEETPAQWPSDDLEFHYDYEHDWELGTGTWFNLRVTAGGQLLFGATDTGSAEPNEFVSVRPDLTPIAIEVDDTVCPAPLDEGTQALMLVFTLGDESVAILSGDEDILPAPTASGRYVIDVQEATRNSDVGDAPDGTTHLIAQLVTP